MDIGVLRTIELRRTGVTARQLRREVASGRLSPVIRGWYATATARPDAVQAIREGGRLSCVSLLAAVGAWRPEDDRVHMAMPPGSDGRHVVAAVPHYSEIRMPFSAAHHHAPLALAVQHLLECQPLDMAVAVLDSLVHRRVVPEQWLRTLLRQLPGALPALQLLDPRAEEGVESVARVRFIQAGYRVETQVEVARAGARVDVRLEGWLDVELDGREFHAQVAAFTRDRTRDGRLVQLHHDVLHFGYAHVMHDWAFVLQTVEAALLRRAPDLTLRDSA